MVRLILWPMHAAFPAPKSDSGRAALYILLGAAAAFVVCILVYTVAKLCHYPARRKGKRSAQPCQAVKAEPGPIPNAVVWDLDMDGHRIIQTDDSMALHGMERVIENVPESLIGSGFILPESADEIRRLFQSLYGGAKGAEGVFKVRLSDGKCAYEHMRYTVIHSRDGESPRAIGLGVAASDCNTAELEYMREQQYRVSVSPDVFASALIDVANGLLHELRSDDPNEFSDLNGKSMSLFYGELANKVAENEEVKLFFSQMTPDRLKSVNDKGGSVNSLEFLRLCDGGEPRWTLYESHLLTDPATGRLTAFIYLRDIDSSKREMNRLRKAAECDVMTGLLDHSATFAHIRRFLTGEGAGGSHALFMVDLDNFKLVNDTFGHRSGDEVITTLSQNLNGLFRASDIVGRVGGDEFLVLMKNIGDGSAAIKKSAEITNNISFVYSSGSSSITIGCSVGLSIYKNNSPDFDTLFRQADSALYDAKNSGRGTYVIYAGGYLEPELNDDRDSSSVQLRTLLENIDGGMVLAEADGESINFTYASPSLFRSMHRTIEDIGSHGEKLFSVVAPEDLPGLKTSILSAVHKAGPVDCVYRVQESDGRDGWRHLRVLRMPGGGRPRLIGVVSNVSDLKESEKELRLSEQRYQMALKQSRAKLWEVDIASKRLLQHESAKAFGRSETIVENVPESLIMNNTIDDESKPELLKMFKDIYSGVPEGRALTHELRAEGGHYVWVRHSYATIFGEDGKPERAVGVFEELPNIGAEKTIFACEETMNALSASMLICTAEMNITTNQIIRFTSGKDERSTQDPGSRDEIISEGLDLRYSDEDRRIFNEHLSRSALQSVFELGTNWLTFDYRIKAGDEPLWVLHAVRLVREPVSGDLYSFGYMRDIDILHSLEQKLGVTVERDMTSSLYTANYMRSLSDFVISQRSDKDGASSMAVLELQGLERLGSMFGASFMANVIALCGRLLRLLSDNELIVGSVSFGRFALFMPGADNNNEAMKRAAELCSRILDIRRMANLIDHVSFSIGAATLRDSDATWQSLLDMASARLAEKPEIVL